MSHFKHLSYSCNMFFLYCKRNYHVIIFYMSFSSLSVKKSCKLLSMMLFLCVSPESMRFFCNFVIAVIGSLPRLYVRLLNF